MDIYALGMVCAYIVFNSDWTSFENRIVEDELRAQDCDAHSTDHETTVVDSLFDTTKESKASVEILPQCLLDFFRRTLSRDPSKRETKLPVLISLMREAYRFK